ncbi:MAG: secondary thiamine-phosphate synthase enzyme YjbQ [Vicinamibacterales bacterium]
MHTFAPVSSCRHTTLEIATEHRTQFVDLTERIETFIAGEGFQAGLVNIQSRHTTTAIIVNEHEPLLLSDFASLLARAVPRHALYRHDDMRQRTVNLTPEERENGFSHCRALLLGAAVCLNVTDGRLQLGRWQRVFLVELDGPRDREVSVLLLGDVGR